jgi:hypothetical protein
VESGHASTIRKVVTGASIGNAVEWFDFAIYGFLATFIAANFFPSGNETAALLKTFAVSRRPSSCARSAASCSAHLATGSDASACSRSSSC